MSVFRFRWRRQVPGRDDAFHAFFGTVRVGQVVSGQSYNAHESWWSWQVVVAPRYAGRADYPRAAARAMEQAFPLAMLSGDRLALRPEREAALRDALELPHPPALEYALAVDRGEHVRPISPTDEGGWDRWLNEERRRGNRHWISPEDMREWFGGGWQDPRQSKQEAATDADLPPRS